MLTNNQISDREAEKASLESQLAEAEAQARRVSSFANFASLQQAREQTVDSLARSRFDWERVLRELAIVIPEDVWLTDLTATVSPAVQLSDTGSSSSSGSSASGMDSVQGPALQIAGLRCRPRSRGQVPRRAQGHRRRDPRLGAELGSARSLHRHAARREARVPAASSGDCATRDFISKFSIVAAFDAVQVSASTQDGDAARDLRADGIGIDGSGADQSQVSDAQQQLDQQKQSTARADPEGLQGRQHLHPGTATAP